MTKDCLSRVLDHDWPGNVRELENEIERLCVLSGDEVEISAANLSSRIQAKSDASYPGLRVQGA